MVMSLTDSCSLVSHRSELIKSWTVYNIYSTGHKEWGLCRDGHCKTPTEAEFLDVIGTNVFLLVFLLFTATSTNGFTPPPQNKSGLKLVFNVNIVNGNLKSENSQDYAQKPQRNCTLMNSASVLRDILQQKKLVGHINRSKEDALFAVVEISSNHLHIAIYVIPYRLIFYLSNRMEQVAIGLC